MTTNTDNKEITWTVTFRDGHIEQISASTGTSAQFKSSNWTEVVSVKPA